ncbi:MAG: cation-translocating P-type ATPase [Bacillota bacterium]|nr:cation-translocating P-type ATPase [Bacillota bacterium]
MMKKINDLLAGIPMTIAAGCFLALSLVFKVIGKEMFIDPAWAGVVISGIPLLYLAIWRIIHNPGISKISSALLISIAMIAAIAIGDLFAAGEVALIMAIGAILEEKTTEKAKKGLKQLIDLTPQQGRRLKSHREEMVTIDEIKVGDIMRVLPGEAVPVDGEIIAGTTSINQSIITGESLPVDKDIGDNVFSGTINRFGAIDIRAAKIGQDSSLEKLITMVREAENKKAPMQRIADKWASWLVPLALVIAIGAYLGTGSIVTGVTVLVVFCPCALVLATPTAIMAAIGQAAKHGVIIKSGEALEKMGKVNAIAFDKTGTLTLGKLRVCDIIPLSEGLDKKSLLTLAAAAEAKSEHPLGKAIVAKARAENIALPEVERFHMTAGRGIYGEVRGKKLFCGNEKFLADNGISVTSKAMDPLSSLREQGKAAILTAVNGKCIGIIGLADVLRPTARNVVEALSMLDTEAILLTGDNAQTAHYMANGVGINKVYSNLLPEEKVAKITDLEKSGQRICMVGDGVNDAPALKTADVGVAMAGMGSDIAIDAAEIALMNDDISKLPYLKRLADAAVKTIKFSIGLSLCINFAAIALSLAGVLTPTTGALVHNAGSVLVVLIAAGLYDRNFEDKILTSPPVCDSAAL